MKIKILGFKYFEWIKIKFFEVGGENLNLNNFVFF